MTEFRELNTKDFRENCFDLISRQWMLITAGDESRCNTMTASWGSMGHLWNKDIATVFIRPQRYTRRFIESHGRYTISVLDEHYRKALAYCGAHSGEHERKIDNAGLSVIYTPGGTPAISQARLIIECRKLYSDIIKPEKFIDDTIIGAMYPEADFHYFYIGEILHVYTK